MTKKYSSYGLEMLWYSCRVSVLWLTTFAFISFFVCWMYHYWILALLINTQNLDTGVSSKVFRYGFVEKAISNILILLYNECNVDWYFPNRTIVVRLLSISLNKKEQLAILNQKNEVLPKVGSFM